MGTFMTRLSGLGITFLHASQPRLPKATLSFVNNPDHQLPPTLSQPPITTLNTVQDTMAERELQDIVRKLKATNDSGYQTSLPLLSKAKLALLKSHALTPLVRTLSTIKDLDGKEDQPGYTIM